MNVLHAMNCAQLKVAPAVSVINMAIAWQAAAARPDLVADDGVFGTRDGDVAGLATSGNHNVAHLQQHRKRSCSRQAAWAVGCVCTTTPAKAAVGLRS